MFRPLLRLLPPTSSVCSAVLTQRGTRNYSGRHTGGPRTDGQTDRWTIPGGGLHRGFQTSFGLMVSGWLCVFASLCLKQSTWRQCGSDFSESAKEPRGSTSPPLCRSWWWSATTHGEFEFHSQSQLILMGQVLHWPRYNNDGTCLYRRSDTLIMLHVTEYSRLLLRMFVFISPLNNTLKSNWWRRAIPPF